MTTRVATHFIATSLTKSAALRTRNSPTSISGTVRISSGSFCTKLPSSSGLSSAAMPGSQSASTTVPASDSANMRACGRTKVSRRR